MKIIPRAEHSISRKNISPNALRILRRLNEAGFEAYLVGGAVRDLLRGGHPKDFDIATDARPEQVKQQFRNCRLIGRRFRLAHVYFDKEIIEVSTFRGLHDPEADEHPERHVVDGMVIRDNVYGTLEEDALRRDFTVNALYYSAADFGVRDFVDGYEDLQKGLMRLIGDPAVRYREDPVRMLRAIRLAAKLEFDIETGAWQAIAECASLLNLSSPARLFDELLKLFFSGHAYQGFLRLQASGLLPYFLPETAKHASGQENAIPKLLEAGLKNTDDRIMQDKSVTPAFLLAVLFWHEAEKLFLQERGQCADVQLTWQKATHELLHNQRTILTLPKRFTLPMQEIWTLQSRLETTTRKKAGRLLAHPRFRAAYDFLELRRIEDQSLAPLFDWWTEVQQKSLGEVAPLTPQVYKPRYQ